MRKRRFDAESAQTRFAKAVCLDAFRRLACNPILPFPITLGPVVFRGMVCTIPTPLFKIQFGRHPYPYVPYLGRFPTLEAIQFFATQSRTPAIPGGSAGMGPDPTCAAVDARLVPTRGPLENVRCIHLPRYTLSGSNTVVPRHMGASMA